jgi:hypothetical protein
MKGSATMILRRVVTHFRKQDWTALFLDFVVVVIGILIAVQVTEWSEARRDRALEREYLVRLHADLESTLDARSEDSSAAQWNETRLAQQQIVLNALRTGVLREEDRPDFETGLAWFGFVGGVEVRRATIEELRSTGAMNLITDVGLRSRILGFDADLVRRAEIAENFMDAIYGFRQQIGGRYEVTRFGGEREDVRLTYDLDALAADPSFLNLLSQIDMLSRFRVDMGRTVLADVAELRDEVARHLETREQ